MGLPTNQVIKYPRYEKDRRLIWPDCGKMTLFWRSMESRRIALKWSRLFIYYRKRKIKRSRFWSIEMENICIMNFS